MWGKYKFSLACAMLLLAFGAAAQDQAPVAKSPDNDLRGVLLLRDQYSVVGLFMVGEDDKPLSKNGATFTVLNDRLTGRTTVTGSGALMYAFYGNVGLSTPGTVNAHTPRITHLAVTPGLEWDVISRNGKAEGSVAARFGSEFEISGGPFQTQYVRANALYITDIATNNAQVYGTEWSFVPHAPLYYIGTSRRINRDLDMWLNFVPTLNLDYFHVSRNGSFGNLIANRDYLWVGPKLSADLYFRSGPLQWLSFSAKYFYLHDALNGSASTVNYLQASVRVGLGNWEVEADGGRRAKLSAVLQHTSGRTPRTLERKDELYAGLELKLGDLR
jgi:hypothetical protein